MKKLIFLAMALCMSSCTVSKECTSDSQVYRGIRQRQEQADRERTNSVCTLYRTDIQDFDVF